MKRDMGLCNLGKVRLKETKFFQRNELLSKTKAIICSLVRGGQDRHYDNFAESNSSWDRQLAASLFKPCRWRLPGMACVPLVLPEAMAMWCEFMRSHLLLCFCHQMEGLERGEPLTCGDATFWPGLSSAFLQPHASSSWSWTPPLCCACLLTSMMQQVLSSKGCVYLPIYLASVEL